MSRRGNCYDNAAMESFWSTLKLELVYRGKFTSRSHARSEIFDYIEIFYNRQRRHTSLRGLSPTQFELKNVSVTRSTTTEGCVDQGKLAAWTQMRVYPC